MGHCECYDVGLELESAMAKTLADAFTNLTSQILRGEGNVIFHAEWDNLYKILTNVHGSNVINSAGGIVIKETANRLEPSRECTLPVYDCSKTNQSAKVGAPPALPPLHIYHRAKPPLMHDGTIFTTPLENDVQWEKAMHEYCVWILCRRVGSSGKQPVPKLGGFISATGSKQPKMSTIGHYTPINELIT